MNKFVIITNLHKDPDLKITNQIMEYIKVKGGQVMSLNALNPEVEKFEELSFDQIPDDTECILVLGGFCILSSVLTQIHFCISFLLSFVL